MKLLEKWTFNKERRSNDRRIRNLFDRIFLLLFAINDNKMKTIYALANSKFINKKKDSSTQKII
ncbi:hypothetical protein BpHYR1_050678 [Brachionus plicatilis]|uniref:Uncharacterized protein n=1 Tax=Brachionus plicatilis TaxID=10195 RepID=A0A3M7SLX7_BRAPC|nr:hypothetical protein BpHYR1_050678 [Brachionus plicatilis]